MQVLDLASTMSFYNLHQTLAKPEKKSYYYYGWLEVYKQHWSIEEKIHVRRKILKKFSLDLELYQLDVIGTFFGLTVFALL